MQSRLAALLGSSSDFDDACRSILQPFASPTPPDCAHALTGKSGSGNSAISNFAVSAARSSKSDDRPPALPAATMSASLCDARATPTLELAEASPAPPCAAVPKAALLLVLRESAAPSKETPLPASDCMDKDVEDDGRLPKKRKCSK